MCKAPCVPPERSATSDPGRLSVGIDATPLLGLPTGVGLFCAGALSGLSALPGLDVSAFAVSWRRRHQIAALVPAGVATLQRAMPARPLHAAWGRFSGPPVEWFIGRHDVVHGTNFVVPPTRRAARVMTVHDLTVVLYPELCDPPSLAFPDLIRRAAAEGAWVHTPSQFVADQVVAELAVDPERVRAVHHGIPLPPADADPGAAAPFRLPEGCHRYLLAIGTVEPRKDYPLLVSAFASVSATHPDVALVIVGGDGWGVERYLAAVEASPARARIVRPGYLDGAALAAALGNASVLVYPSRYEGFGFPPLQAMAAGVPVVATAVGAVPEVVGDGALLTAPGDGDELAGAVTRVLAGGAAIDALVERGRRRSGQFSWKACAEGLALLYADACRSSGSRVSGPEPTGGRR
ncbi:MAG: glycosyltransferase family 1 protein [Acidimicrobiales bacterium]|jgi:glycosyltransferase involved in cell wall biosynthesis